MREQLDSIAEIVSPDEEEEGVADDEDDDTEAVTSSDVIHSLVGAPHRRRVLVMQRAPDRTAPASRETPGLSQREKREVAEPRFHRSRARLPECAQQINQLCARQEARKRAPSPESVSLTGFCLSICRTHWRCPSFSSSQALFLVGGQTGRNTTQAHCPRTTIACYGQPEASAIIKEKGVRPWNKLGVAVLFEAYLRGGLRTGSPWSASRC